MGTPPEKTPIILSRALKALAGSIPGIALGLFCHHVLEYGAGASLFVGTVGGFIGAALAQPDVSTRNVLRGTAGVIAAHNAPGFMADGILDAAFKNASRSPESASTVSSNPTNPPHRSQPAGPAAAPDPAAGHVSGAP